MVLATVGQEFCSAIALGTMTMKGNASRWCFDTMPGRNRSGRRSWQASGAVECPAPEVSREAEYFDFTCDIFLNELRGNASKGRARRVRRAVTQMTDNLQGASRE